MTLRDRIHDALTKAVATLPPAEYPAIEVSETRDVAHGDYACNFALAATKAAGIPPRQIAERLKAAIEGQGDLLIADIEVAGPGFLNFRLDPAEVGKSVGAILEDGGFYKVKNANPKKLNVEYVSVNPNGPITVGSGRGAAFGSTLCNVLEAAGHSVHREYYINDGVNSEQMRMFAVSVKALAKGEELPEKAYRGDYVQDVADKLRPKAETTGWPEDVGWWQAESQALMLAKQREDLAAFGVEFDTWFSEQSLHDGGLVEAEVSHLVNAGLADERPFRTVLKLAKGGVIEEVRFEEQPVDEDDAEGAGATLWLRATKLGDDMDRVLRRKDGRLTYIASDVAYHKDKYNRPEGADKLITILGPDHHGYIGRLHAVVAAVFADGKVADASQTPAGLYGSAEEEGACATLLAASREKLEVVIFQIVRFVKDGQPAPMRKRDGNIYALIDLVDEVGKIMAPEGPVEEQRRIGRDVSRFFYLMRSHDTHMDFDIDLATKKSDENPVFYVQYAHARICSILRKASDELPLLAAQRSDLGLLVHPRETALVKKLYDLPWEIQRAAEDYGVNRLTAYAQELARTFHHFYDACRVVDASAPELTQARLSLCRATQATLRAVFELLGISAPEQM